MEPNTDFSALRNLLALKKLEMPLDTEVNRFLIEFHRRQRAQLLVPASRWSLAVNWLKERALGLPSLSCASAFAAIAVAAFVGLSQQVQVTQVAGQYQLSFRMPAPNASFAMVPTSFSQGSSTDNFNFSPNRSGSVTTRFVLANNSRTAYDATAAF